jgi:Helix-turn-helix domain
MFVSPPNREALEELVEAGLTVRAMAARLERSPTTIRFWLRRYELQTDRMRVLALGSGDRPPTFVRTCRVHGRAEHVSDERGTYRCKRCRVHRVTEYRRRVKQRLVAEAGGACALCGYDRCLGALEFHHIDRSEKSFGISGRGLAYSMDSLRREAKKCVLLCSNCHVEVETGLTMLSPDRVQRAA